MQLGYVCQVDGWSPQFDSTLNLAHHSDGKCLRQGPDKRAYAPDTGGTSRTGTAAYRSWRRRVRQTLINGAQIVYDAGFYPARDTGGSVAGSWQALAADASAWSAYNSDTASGDYRDSVPPPGPSNALWAAGVQVDVELITYARQECVALGLDPDQYIIIVGPNEPGAIGGKGANAFGWNFSTGGNSFVSWMNYTMPALRSAFPNARIETPILGGLFNSTSVTADLTGTLNALSSIVGLGMNMAPYNAFAINCYISFKGQTPVDNPTYAAYYINKVQHIAGKLAQLGLPSRISINEIGVSKDDMNIGFMSMVGQGVRLRRCLEELRRCSFVDRALIFKSCSANSGEDSSTAGEYGMIRFGSGGTQGQWNASAAHIIAMSKIPPATANSAHADLKLSDDPLMGDWVSSGVATRATGYYAPAGQASVEGQVVGG